MFPLDSGGTFGPTLHRPSPPPQNTTEMLCFQCIISEGNDLDTLLLGILLLEFLLLVMLTLIRIRWCLPAFFTVELLFSLYY